MIRSDRCLRGGVYLPLDPNYSIIPRVAKRAHDAAMVPGVCFRPVLDG